MGILLSFTIGEISRINRRKVAVLCISCYSFIHRGNVEANCATVFSSHRHQNSSNSTITAFITTRAVYKIVCNRVGVTSNRIRTDVNETIY
uniref:Hexosyltransferase n=1 Tax=Parascaris univalens TaxID=6257 RepID=A0A914ZDK3_PARUN